MTRAACAFAFAIIACAFAAHAATTKQVDDAIAKAKSWLYKQQLPDGTWEIPFEEHGDQKTGQTALVLYALLSAGESCQDPRLAKAIEYLKKTDTTGVYALGVRCQVWLMLPPTLEVRGAMTKDARILQQSIKRSGEGKGFYDYNPAGGNRYSHSRAQYAILGLWAASQSGIDVPIDYWKLVEKSWIDHQDASGGWNYGYKRESYPITPGMTAVGVATLFITQDFVHANEGLSGTGGNVRNPAIDRGMRWLADNFSKVATDEKYPRDYPYATLYAVERVGVTSGQKFFGNNDWYAKGSDWLLKQQRSDGSFPIEYGVKTAST